MAQENLATNTAAESAGDGDFQDTQGYTLDEAVAALGDETPIEDEQPDDDAEEPQAEAEEEGDEPDDDEADVEDADDPDSDDGEDDEAVTFTMDDGEEVSLAQLKRERLMHRDYTAKTQEVAQQREELTSARERLATSAQIIQQAYADLNEYVESLIPPEPPASLYYQDRPTYDDQTFLRTRIVGELQQVMARSQQVNGAVKQADEAELAAQRKIADDKLLASRPGLKDPGRLAEFKDANWRFAKDFGFTDQELAVVTDHRIHELLALARIGDRAEKNRKAAKQRVKADAPAPNKGKRPTRQVTRQANPNRQALRRLQQTGSLEDAMRIDIE